MNRADQEALYQTTNQGLLQIRQSEVNYYQSLNVAFGTQAALIGGFTYGVFSQNQINYSNNYSNVEVLADIYWVCSAITIALAVHVILCTMLMQVLGPGLALNGPVGSMARATEGMRIEQKQIIFVFIAMMVMFSLSTVLSCWVVMSVGASIVCTLAFSVAACYWYKYCERIYLRFYWEQEEAGWNRHGNSSDNLHEEEPSPHHAHHAHHRLSSHRAKSMRVEAKRKGILGYLFRSKTKHSHTGHTLVPGADASEHQPVVFSPFAPVAPVAPSPAASVDAAARTPQAHIPASESTPSIASDYSGIHGGLSLTSNWVAASASRGVEMEGYLTQHGGGNDGEDTLIDLLMHDVLHQEVWERRYFTLTDEAYLFIYKTRQDYRDAPKEPIYTRPLRLMDYFVEVHNSDSETRSRAHTMEGSTAASDTNTHTAFNAALGFLSMQGDDSDMQPNRFQMTLVLRENVEAAAKRLTVARPAAQAPRAPAGNHGLGSGQQQGQEWDASNRLGIAETAHKEKYRNHWVLRCDTEEELQQWVGVMRELCPSCFQPF